MIAVERLAEVFVEVADTLVDNFDVIEFLQMVSTRTADVVEVSAVGLLLSDVEGGLQLVSASDERAQMVELFQIQAHEGPCHDCYRSGVPVLISDLTEEADRWPRFAPRAVGAGYRSVHAFPMRLRNNVIGALNLFSLHEGEMSSTDVRVVQALADIATIGLLQERAIRRSADVAAQLQGALNSRVVIEQAKGALAQLHHCTVDEAFELLRSHARRHGLRLSDLAREVTSGEARIPGLTTPSPDDESRS